MQDDVIYRQAAIEKNEMLYRDVWDDTSYIIIGYNHALSDMKAILKSLPSAQPEPLTDIDQQLAAHEQIGYDKGWRDGYAQATVDAPTIDAVEVVRCKDCVILQYCRFAQGLGLDGFCSQGGRKNETD